MTIKKLYEVKRNAIKTVIVFYQGVKRSKEQDPPTFFELRRVN
jgi:hypothetical protein